jgi:HEAT repeat protein
LNADEPDYGAAARLGQTALPHLEVLARDAGPGMAAKAVYLASLIAGESASAVIEAASRRTDPVMRVAAAAALGRVSADRLPDVAARLLADPEDGVRRRALAALPPRYNPVLADRLDSLADTLPSGARRDDVLRALQRVR